MADINSLTQTIYTCLEKAVNLKIVTYVGEVKPELSADAQTETLKLKWTNLPQGNINFVLATQINLLEGDIVNVVPENILDKQWLKDYHLEQVKAGREIVESNFNMLAETLKKIASLNT